MYRVILERTLTPLARIFFRAFLGIAEPLCLLFSVTWLSPSRREAPSRTGGACPEGWSMVPDWWSLSRRINGGEAYSPEIWSMVPDLFRGERGLVRQLRQ